MACTKRCAASLVLRKAEGEESQEGQEEGQEIEEGGGPRVSAWQLSNATARNVVWGSARACREADSQKSHLHWRRRQRKPAHILSTSARRKLVSLKEKSQQTCFCSNTNISADSGVPCFLVDAACLHLHSCQHIKRNAQSPKAYPQP